MLYSKRNDNGMVSLDMSDKLWKACERKFMALFDGTRVPITGRTRGSSPDGRGGKGWGWMSIEIKHRKRLPDWIHDAMDQAIAAGREGQLPVVLLHQKGKAYLDSYVMMRARDFREWFGD